LSFLIPDFQGKTVWRSVPSATVLRPQPLLRSLRSLGMRAGRQPTQDGPRCVPLVIPAVRDVHVTVVMV